MFVWGGGGGVMVVLLDGLTNTCLLGRHCLLLGDMWTSDLCSLIPVYWETLSDWLYVNMTCLDRFGAVTEGELNCVTMPSCFDIHHGN